MDEIYIKMCDSPEIQGRWEMEDGARYSLNGTIFTLCDLYRCTFFEVEEHPEDYNPLYLSEYHNVFRKFIGGYEWEAEKIGDLENAVWLPRQEDWQTIIFNKHYAPAIPTLRKLYAATMIMFREHLDYMEAWKIEQPCEAWVRLFMNVCHKKQWTEKGWA